LAWFGPISNMNQIQQQGVERPPPTMGTEKEKMSQEWE
jgi:hypothetical protein